MSGFMLKTLLIFVTVLFSMLSEAASPVDYDTNFAFGGATVVDYAPGFNYRCTAVQPDGKIVVTGSLTVGEPAHSEIRVYRLTSTGDLDPDFSTDGMIDILYGGKHCDAFAVTVQADGKILFAGYVTSSVNQTRDFAVFRYNSNGTRDNSFDGDGLASLELVSGFTEIAYAISIQADNKIVVSGLATKTGLPESVFLCRLNSNGSLDSTFGTGGKTVFESPVDFISPRTMKIGFDGKILVGAFGGDGETYHAIMMRYLPDGNLDSGFGSAGIVSNGFESGSKFLEALEILSDGKILVAGSVRTNLVYEPDYTYLARHNADGSYDVSFGNGGKVITDFGLRSGGLSVALQKDARIVIGGHVFVPISYGVTFTYVAISRYDPDGKPDQTFGVGGKWTSIADGIYGQARTIHVHNDWKILVAGQIAGRFGAARLRGGTSKVAIGNASMEPLSPASFRVFGSPNQVCRIESSVDLLSWDLVTAGTFIDGFMDFADNQPVSDFSRRFFRIVSP